MKNISKLLLNIILIITLSINIFNKLYDNKIVILALLIYGVINLLIDGYRRPNKRDLGNITLIVTIGCFFTISFYYFLGTFTEFSKNYAFILYKYLKTSAFLSVILIVILTELIRYITMQAPKGSKRFSRIINISLFIIFVLIDVCISQKVLNTSSFTTFYEFFALTFCASVTKNVFLMWLTYKYGYIPCIIYRVMIDLYVYFLPVVPKANMLLQAVLFMLMPFILYKIIDSVVKERALPKANDIAKKRIDRLESVFLIIIFAILASLVSREFKYSMIGVGSGSMTGTINKGDAIIYEKYDGRYLNEGEIIVFKIENTMIVHRIHKRFLANDTYYYMTKGDYNENVDNWVVEPDMILGVVKQRVLWIAWPSVWISEKY